MIIKRLQRLFLVLLIAAGLYASVRNLIATGELGSVSDDPVADWEKRFTPIKQRLPFERGVVGYISDSSIPGAPYDAANDEGEYVLTQYVMSPVVIVKGTAQEWDIANLDRQAFDMWSKSNEGKFEVTAFKGGLYLLHRIGN
jgi:hypothetical protein